MVLQVSLCDLSKQTVANWIKNMINADLVQNCTSDSIESACYVKSVKSECVLDLTDFTYTGYFLLYGERCGLLSMEGSSHALLNEN